MILWGTLLAIGATGFTTYKLVGGDSVQPPQSVVQMEAAPHVKQVALIGNSHAGILKDALTTYFAKQGYDLKIFDQGGCTPFWNLDRHDTGHAPQGCEKDINRGIETVIQQPTMDTVVFAARFEDPGALYDISNPGTDRVGAGLAPSDAHNWTLFESALDDTLARLTAAHKRIIIIENVPTLPFGPKECINRPLRVASTMRHPCAVAKSQVLADQKAYRDIIERIARKYPDVVVFNPLPAFCDAQYCYGRTGDEVLYRDRNHLSDDGVRRLSPHFNF